MRKLFILGAILTKTTNNIETRQLLSGWNTLAANKHEALGMFLEEMQPKYAGYSIQLWSCQEVPEEEVVKLLNGYDPVTPEE